MRVLSNIMKKKCESTLYNKISDITQNAKSHTLKSFKFIGDALSFAVNILFKTPFFIFSPIILIFIYFLLWKISSLIQIPLFQYVHELYTYADLIDHYSTDIAILGVTTKILIVALPLSLTFFYFSYKEQKALAISSASFWNISTRSFGMLALVSIVLGVHLKVTMNTTLAKDPAILIQDMDNLFSLRVLIWLLCFFGTIIFGISAIKVHIANLNYSSQFNFALKKVNKSAKALANTYFDFQRKKAFDNIYSNVDALYQVLFLAIEKNTVSFLKNAMRNWGDALFSLSYDSDFAQKNIIGPSKINGDDYYRDMYRSILKNHVTLINKLFTAHKFEDAYESLDIFVKLESKEQEYYTALHELSLLLYKQDNLNVILQILNRITNIYKNKEMTVDEVNIIYKQLLILTIEKNDIKSLSSLIYSLLKNYKQPNSVKGISKIIPLPILTSNIQDSNLNECIVYLVLQSLLKSIELSHYSCTGLLIKFLITNFNGEIIKKTYGIAITNLIKKKKGENPYLAKSKISNIHVSFNFNITTLRYCYEKMSILIYCEQKFVKERKIRISNNINSQPPIDIFGLNYDLGYLFDKLNNVGMKYGLLYFDDTDFMGNMQKEIENILISHRSHPKKKKILKRN
ncbi:hypothetical protein ACFRAM_08210 [Paenibacillus sp. NPDC056722]|uniref:hypothetical protein n=1 Tax=Paenibacillus sp. NPDC056722 TaxID=3345924 RepID=UPI0036B4524A